MSDGDYKLRDDIDPANTWVVSDTHFGHQNIVGFCHRPMDHEQVMIAEWRAHVPDDATVIHLGDLCYKGNAFFKNIVAPELTGARKILVLGNHDRGRYSFYRDCGFKILKHGFAINVAFDPETGLIVADSDLPLADQGVYTVSFSHYPLKEPLKGGRLHLHGHIHNNGYGGKDTPFTPFSAGQINLSVEQTKYRPVNLQRLLTGALMGCYERPRDNK